MNRRILLASLTADELDNLSIEQLADRMDEVLRTNRMERRQGDDPLDDWPEDARRALRPTASAFVNTVTVRTFDLERKRRVVQHFFALLVQIELTHAAFGLMNLAVYTPDYDFRSPRFRFTKAMLQQYAIISSRIVAEVLLDLLHDLGTGKRLPNNGRSRLKKFREWLSNSPSSPYVYFAHAALAAYKYDRHYRTPEIHGGSRYPRRLLRLEQVDPDEAHGYLELINTLGNIFGPLLDILDGGRPQQFREDVTPAWMEAYRSDDAAEIERLLREIFSKIEE